MAGSSFEESVRSVLSDTMNLPQEFLGYLIQNQALNPVPVAKTSGQRLAYGTNTSSVSTTGTTFGTGADLLSSNLEFQAVGNNDYIVTASAFQWANDTSTDVNVLHLNLDGADAGIMAESYAAATSQNIVLNARGIIVKPSAGGHSVNVRLRVTGGTGTISAGSGGAATGLPIIVTIEVA